MTDGDLVEAAFRAELVASWHSPEQSVTQGLVHLVDYWRRYHAIKIAIALALLAVLVSLGISLRQRARAMTYVLGALGLFTLMLVMVNIQATAAPLAALLQALPTPDSAAAAGTYSEIGQALAEHRSVPVLDAIIDSFGDYHAVMAIESAVVALGFVVCSVWARRVRRPERLIGTVAALLAVGLIVATVAGVRISLDAPDALQQYFSGVER